MSEAPGVYVDPVGPTIAVQLEPPSIDRCQTYPYDDPGGFQEPPDVASATPSRGVPVIAGAVTLTGAPPSTPLTARSALTRPPVTDLPARSGLASVDAMTALFTSSALAPGRTDSASAATPAAFGLAIEVPHRFSYAGDVKVERIVVPGAKTSTLVAP